MLGLPTQLVILSEAKDLTDASISIADRRVVPGAELNKRSAHAR
jgi:hypothetical protein